MKILTFPIPVLSAGLSQLFPAGMDGAPQWILSFLMGAWVILWLMDKMGKLPSNGKERREGRVNLKEDIDKLHEIVKELHQWHTHEDRPGWKIWWFDREYINHVISALGEVKTAIDKQSELTARHSRLLEDHEKIVGINVETLRAMREQINQANSKIDHLIEKVS